MRSARELQTLWADRRGVTAITTALLMVVVLGFVGLGIDVGAGYASRRSAQGAADSAAFTAALAQNAGAADFAAEARGVTASYGLVDGQKGVKVTVNSPPITGAFTGDSRAVEVVVSRPGQQFFSGLIGAKAFTIRVRAVATIQQGGGDGCVLALDPTDASTVTLNGTPNVVLNGCSLHDNSASPQAFLANGSGSLSAKSVNIVGGDLVNGPFQISPINTGALPASDPYAQRPVPTPSGASSPCSGTTVNGSKTVSFPPAGGSTPYIFCGGLTINGNATVNFAPGIYFIKNGSFLVNGNSTVTGSGVTFVLTGDTGGQVGTVTINGGTNVTLSAPVDGATSGMLFFQDRSANHFGSNVFNGGATETLTGALYFPNQAVTYNGGNSTTASGCTHLLAWQITFNGNPQLANNCKDAGVSGFGGFHTVLVE